MKNTYDGTQLFLRLALGAGFILPVLDRLGLLGAPGTNGNAWGNWENFAGYSHTLMPYLSDSLSAVFAGIATLAELVFGVALIIGFQTRNAARGSFVLTLIFAVSMFFFASYRAPFSYSVLVDSAASLLLSMLPVYRWSLDYVKSSKRDSAYI